MNTLKVVIMGKPGNGKSTIARQIEKHLLVQGIAVVAEHCEEHSDQEGWMTRQEDRMDSLRAKGTFVHLEEVQVHRNADLSKPTPRHWDPGDYPVGDWKYEVANDDTRLGYHDWCQHKTEGSNETST